MNPEEQHVALPKLYGAPAYARPPRSFDATDRPPDPDDLPLEAFRVEDDPTAGGHAASPAPGPVGGPEWGVSTPTEVVPAPATAARPATWGSEGADDAGEDGAAEADAVVDGAATEADGVGMPGAPAPAEAAGEPAAPVGAPAEAPAATLQPRPFTVRGLARFLHRS